MCTYDSGKSTSDNGCNPGECNRCTNTVEALNRVIRNENHRRTSGIGACFRRRVGQELKPTLPLYELGNALPDDDDEDELVDIENNNPPGHAELPVNDQVDNSTARMMLSPLVETDEDDYDDDASSTALGLAAHGSDASPASTTTLDHPVDGSDAPQHRPLHRLAGRWERFVGGRRCHGRWFQWQRCGTHWRWCHGRPLHSPCATINIFSNFSTRKCEN